VVDLGRFMIAHLNRGCVEGACVLPPLQVAQMHTRQFTHHPILPGMTYSFLENEINGQRLLWHMGQSSRFITLLALVPEHNLGLVVSYNTPSVNAREILFGFMDAFFPASRTPLPQSPLPGWEDRAAQFNGFYVPARSAHTNQQILLRYHEAAPARIEQGRLTFSCWRFVETEPGLFRQQEGDRLLAFGQDANGQNWLYLGPLAYFRRAWYETSAFLLSLLGVSLLASLSAWIAWPLAASARRKTPAGRGLLTSLAFSAGLGAFALTLFTADAFLLPCLPDRLVYQPGIERLIAAVSWLAVPWAGLILAWAVRALLRREWAFRWRVYYTAAALVWLLWELRLLGVNF
jgi:hypothetical protein